MVAMNQTIFSFDPLPKKTRKGVFLEEMNRVVPWSQLVGLIAPHACGAHQTLGDIEILGSDSNFHRIYFGERLTLREPLDARQDIDHQFLGQGSVQAWCFFSALIHASTLPWPFQV